MAINYNTDPYWDDFNAPTAVDGLSPKEKYNRILFRPGVPLQARELTQLQSQLQHQISSIGDHAFKEGAMIIPGGVHVNNRIEYIKCSSLSTDAEDFIGVELSDGTNIARVIHAEASDTVDPDTLYLKFISGNDIFVPGAALTGTLDSGVVVSATVGNDLDSNDLNITGQGSLVSVDDGIYYIRKHFIVVKSDTIIVGKYDAIVSKEIGFFVTESLIGPGEDISLNDNALGSPNETAPGAHRLQIKTVLGAKDSATSASNFILLVSLLDGDILSQVLRTDYALIEETLSRRTYDESGNYSINPITATLKPGLIASTVHLAVEPCKAYVHGHELETLSNTNVSIDRARETELSLSQTINVGIFNYVDIGLSLAGHLPVSGNVVTIKGNNQTVATANVASIQQVVQGSSANADRYRINLVNLVLSQTSGVWSYTPDALEIAGSSFVIENQSWQGKPLVTPLPRHRVATHDIDTTGLAANFDYRYEISRKMSSFAVVNNSNTLTFSCASTETFTDTNTDDWILYVELDGANSPVDQVFRRADISSITLNQTLNNQSVDIVINVTQTIAATLIGSTVQLVAPVIKTSIHREKTLNLTEVFDINTLTVDFLVWQDLNNVDAIRLTKVGEWDISGTGVLIKDVTEHFELDSGQRDTVYSTARVRQKASSHYTSPSDVNKVLRFTYDYFSHSAGDYFTVDSYTTTGISYDEIPTYEGIDLRDAVDFRSAVGTTSIAPRTSTTFETNLQYYLPRLDKVALTDKGAFVVLSGIPSLEPALPDDMTGAMTVFWLYIPAYTDSPSNIGIKNIDNKRYTMRDIGGIEKRVNRLEYYSSLNFLENVANNQQIFGTSGTDRFKSGFIADPFINSKVAQVTSPEFNASIDKKLGQCRPTFEENNVSLTPITSSLPATAQTGPLLHLPHTPQAIITQLQSSDTINVNPYDVFNWTGTLELTPSTDEWKEVQRLPDVIINDESQYDSLLRDMERTTATGTVWNEWTVNWAGAEVTGTSSSTQRWSEAWRGGDSLITTTTESTDRTRTGITTEIVPSTVIRHEGDRVVEVNFIPFMRSRLVECELTRCRPNTTLFAFFDGEDITDYVTQNLAPTNMDLATAAVLSSFNNLNAHPSGASPLITDGAGSLSFTFWVPNDDNLRFTSGTKDLVLTDNVDNDSSLSTTSAVAEYSAKGLLEKKENVTVSTRVPKVVRSDASETAIWSWNTTTQSNRRTTWVDPLAQSIMIDLDGGVFLTSLDLYFATADANLPVTISIREMQNGMPTQILIPFSEVTLHASSVNTDGSPTTFDFPSLVYLEESREYCFVIMANSNQYNVHYGTIGERDTVTDDMIQGQPYAGVMFKSSNASTWTAMQESDIKFELNRAVFDTTVATIDLEPEVVPPSKLIYDPFITDGTTIVNVKHTNHGLNNGDRVVFSGSDPFAGVTEAEINDINGFLVTNITKVGYDITVSQNTTDSGIYGGGIVTAQHNILFNIMYPYITTLQFPNTQLHFTVQETHWDGNQYTTTSRLIDINSDMTTAYPQYVLSDLNATIASKASNGLKVTASLLSSVDNLSPIIDTERCSVITIKNNINNDSTNEGLYNQGLAEAKYLTKTVELAEDADSLKVWMDISRPTGSTVKVFARAGTDYIADADWMEADATIVPYSDNVGEFNEVMFDISNISTSFNRFDIKVVFLSTNTSRVPVIQNFRAIAVI